MIDRLQRVTARVLNGVRVNRIQQTVQDGAPVFVKRRRLGGSIVVWFGNLFLILARDSSRMLVSAQEWVQWEIYCAGLLYPGRPAVRRGTGNSVIIPAVTGMSLRQLIHSNKADASAFRAAARELRRVHQIPCSYYKQAWSHGDLHLDNVMYDGISGSAVLIDFDTRHDPRISSTQRHSHDLQLMLLELLAVPDELWLPATAALIKEYRDTSVLQELVQQLFVPRGTAGILWRTRTGGCSMQIAEHRLEAVRQMIRRLTAPDLPDEKAPRDRAARGEQDCPKDL